MSSFIDYLSLFISFESLALMLTVVFLFKLNTLNLSYMLSGFWKNPFETKIAVKPSLARQKIVKTRIISKKYVA